jgi:hypothetical protein
MKAQKPVFFRRTPWVVFVLALVTGGVYAVYWFYRQWRAVEKASGTSKFAILAAIFDIFTAYNLFRHIVKSVSSDKKLAIIIPLVGLFFFSIVAVLAGVVSAAFMIIGGWTYAAMIIGVGLLFSGTLGYMQFLANGGTKGRRKQKMDKSLAGEKAVIIIGIFLTISNILLIAFMVPATVYAERVAGLDSQVNLLDRRATQQYEVYEQCDAKLQETVATVDTYDEEAVAAYLADAEECDELYQEYSDTFDEMTGLIGQYFWALFR